MRFYLRTFYPCVPQFPELKRQVFLSNSTQFRFIFFRACISFAAILRALQYLSPRNSKTCLFRGSRVLSFVYFLQKQPLTLFGKLLRPTGVTKQLLFLSLFLSIEPKCIRTFRTSFLVISIPSLVSKNSLLITTSSRTCCLKYTVHDSILFPNYEKWLDLQVYMTSV